MFSSRSNFHLVELINFMTNLESDIEISDDKINVGDKQGPDFEDLEIL